MIIQILKKIFQKIFQMFQEFDENIPKKFNQLQAIKTPPPAPASSTVPTAPNDSQYQTVTDKHFFKRDSLLTKTETAFYNTLKKTLLQEEIIVIKPRLEDVIGASFIPRNKTKHQANRGKIRSRHFDFVICNKNIKPLFAIELDDKSHNTNHAKKIDGFKNNLCLSVQLRLLRIPVETTYDTALLRAIIYQQNQ